MTDHHDTWSKLIDQQCTDTFWNGLLGSLCLITLPALLALKDPGWEKAFAAIPVAFGVLSWLLRPSRLDQPIHEAWKRWKLAERHNTLWLH